MFSLDLDHDFLDPVRGVNRHKREKRPCCFANAGLMIEPDAVLLAVPNF